MKAARIILALTFVGLPVDALAQAPAESLDALLARVRKGYDGDSEALRAREAEFKKSRDQQAALLATAREELEAANAKSVALETEFQANELALTEKEQTLQTRLGTMGELFGVVRQVAGDTTAQLSASVVSSQLGGRIERVEKLAQSQSLPSIEELRHLWFALQEEMTETGKVARYDATVIDDQGKSVKQSVVRVGAFNVVSDAGYLQYLPEVGKLAQLAKQPPEHYLSAVAELSSAKSGVTRFPIDPSRGVILSLLIEAPSLEERIQLGGLIGYFVLGLGAFAFIVALVRFVGLTFTNSKIRAQLQRKTASDDNPVGRVLKVYEDNRGITPDDLERKLDEVVVRESARLDRFLWIVKVVAVSAPLLGLLGTVTGMIRTFQAITLFGTGDPKLMAGGISEALVTTMLGLVVAIPLVLSHAALTNISRRLVDIVEEQAAGVVADRAESEGEALPDA